MNERSLSIFDNSRIGIRGPLLNIARGVTDPFFKEICPSKIVRNSLHHVNYIGIFDSSDSNTIHFLSISFLNPICPDTIVSHITV